MKQDTKQKPAARKRAASGDAPHFLTYSPEIEAKRADYKSLAASLLTMIDLDMEHVKPLLDVKSEYTEGEDHVLMGAIDRHLYLAFMNVDWFKSEAIRLYVEMRLLADEQKHQGTTYRELQATQDNTAAEKKDEARACYELS